MEQMTMLLLLLFVAVVAYMLFLKPSSRGGLFEDCNDLRDKYQVQM